MRFCFYLNQKCQIRTTLYRAAKKTWIAQYWPVIYKYYTIFFYNIIFLHDSISHHKISVQIFPFLE